MLVCADVRCCLLVGQVGMRFDWRSPNLTPRAILLGGNAFKQAVLVTSPGSVQRHRVDVAKLSIYYVVLLVIQDWRLILVYNNAKHFVMVVLVVSIKKMITEIAVEMI